MQKDYFAKQIDRLRTAYSSAAVNDERVKVLWENFKHVDADVWERAVSWVIGECTTQALPSVSRFNEGVGRFQNKANYERSEREPYADCRCPPCRDFGYGWVGDTVVACACDLGRSLSPTYIAARQTAYNLGARFMRKVGGSPLPPLPYDPKERQGA